MREIVPGIWHWTSEHPKWGIVIHSYVLPEERVVIDPMASSEVLDELERLGPPTDVLLTNRHHYRSSGELRERFGATVRCVREGMHEFASDQVVQPFDFGDELPGGILAHRVGSICRTRLRSTSRHGARSRWPMARFARRRVLHLRSCPISSWTIPRERRRAFATRTAGSRRSSTSTISCSPTASRSSGTAELRSPPSAPELPGRGCAPGRIS